MTNFVVFASRLRHSGRLTVLVSLVETARRPNVGAAPRRAVAVGSSHRPIRLPVCRADLFHELACSMSDKRPSSALFVPGGLTFCKQTFKWSSRRADRVHLEGGGYSRGTSQKLRDLQIRS